ncbi:MAG: YgjV family protein [Clostridiales bacterium]|nr:YgjV family protein [Candidatus Blautia equi]
MSNYAIAMVLSFITACFTLASSWTKDPHRTYWYQVGQCLVYAGAAYFLGVYPCIIMMLINAWRNYLIAVDKYKASYCFVFSILALVLGLWTNTSGVVGLLTIFATIQYSICSYYLKSDITVKINVAVNLLIWFCYDVLVRDIFSGTMDSISALLAIITIWRIIRDRKNMI